MTTILVISFLTIPVYLLAVVLTYFERRASAAKVIRDQDYYGPERTPGKIRQIYHVPTLAAPAYGLLSGFGLVGPSAEKRRHLTQTIRSVRTEAKGKSK